MAEITLEQLETALRKAHAAGDEAGAHTLADAYRARKAAESKPAPKAKTETTFSDIVAGFPLSRAASGVADPFIGLAQLAAHALGIGDETIDRVIKDRAASKRRGMDYWAELTGVTSPGNAPDWFGLLGNVGTGSALASKLPAATTALKSIAQGAGAGGAMGATTPVVESDPQDFWHTKQGQAILGLVAGTITPAMLEGATGAGWLAETGLDYLLGKPITADILKKIFTGSRPAAKAIAPASAETTAAARELAEIAPQDLPAYARAAQEEARKILSLPAYAEEARRLLPEFNDLVRDSGIVAGRMAGEFPNAVTAERRRERSKPPTTREAATP